MHCSFEFGWLEWQKPFFQPFSSHGTLASVKTPAVFPSVNCYKLIAQWAIHTVLPSDLTTDTLLRFKSKYLLIKYILGYCL